MTRGPRGHVVRPLVAATVLTATSLALGGGPAVAAEVRSTVAGGTVAVGSDDIEFEPAFPALKDVPSPGAASAYPSTISVPLTGVVTGVRVNLKLLHSRFQDLDVLLVGPHGQTATVMSDAGSTTSSLEIHGLTFTDEAQDPMPEDDPGPVDAEWLPTDYGTEADVYPPPAPSPGGTSLSVFEGTSAAGVWSLYVVDDDPAGAAGWFDWTLSLDVATVPYPSTIDVKGLGTVTDLDVVLTDIDSTYPTDMDLLLVGPQGQQATILSDAGGEFDLDGYDVVLSDEAPVQAPDEDPLVEPRYRPANWSDQDDGFEPPAPTQSPEAALSVFDGTDPHGQWRLFANDDEGGDYTTIGGWGLEITWDDSVVPAGALTVAGGAVRTRTAAVTLALAASDPAPSSGVSEVRLSNDGSNWSAYQPLTSSAPWTLSAGDGPKTVHAQFRDRAGNVSSVVSDAIVLDTSAPKVRRKSPRSDATDVPPGAKVKIVVSEALDPATVGTRAVVLSMGGKRVKAEVRYLPGKRKLVLEPRKPLSAGMYTVTVARGVADLAGNRIDGKTKPGVQRVRWTFRVSS